MSGGSGLFYGWVLCTFTFTTPVTKHASTAK